MMTELWVKNLCTKGYIESESLNITDKGIPRESTKDTAPKPLTLEEIISLKGTDSFYRFHRDTLKTYSGYASKDPRLKEMLDEKYALRGKT